MAEADPRLGRAGSLETLSTLRAGSTLAAASSLPPAEALELGRAGVDDVRPRSLPGYEILEELGHGSTGFVFRARQANLERDVAVKTSRSIAASDPDHRLRFLSEALVTGSLDHPNVVPTHDLVFDQEGRPSLAMKLIGGLTWDALLHPKRLTRTNGFAISFDRRFTVIRMDRLCPAPSCRLFHRLSRVFEPSLVVPEGGALCIAVPEQVWNEIGDGFEP